MEKYIKKSVLVKEIEKCYNECVKRAKITDGDYWYAKAVAHRDVLEILDDTLEVKDVDLDKEINFNNMDYKKKYKEILEAVRNLLEVNPSDEGIKNWVNENFPELKESEDERIRKELLEHCKNQAEPYIRTGNKCPQIQSWIAWLEKQGKKFIPENIDEAALQYVDTCAVDGEVTHDNVTEPYWNNHSMMKAYKAGWLKQGEQNPAWSEEDKRMYRGLYNLIYSTPYCDSRKELSDWLASIKDRVLPQPKQEWSEEDEIILNGCIHAFEKLLEEVNDEDPQVAKDLRFCYRKNINWLKSLRPQKQWKPSKEQVDAIEFLARSYGESGTISPYSRNMSSVMSLLSDLKKLIE